MASNFVDNSQAVLIELAQRQRAALNAIGMVAETHAKKICPVDTGRLRNSIANATTPDTAYIGTNVEYASYVELGTSRMKAKPYLKPAIVNHVSEYKELAIKALKGD